MPKSGQLTGRVDRQVKTSSSRALCALDGERTGRGVGRGIPQPGENSKAVLAAIRIASQRHGRGVPRLAEVTVACVTSDDVARQFEFAKLRSMH